MTAKADGLEAQGWLDREVICTREKVPAADEEAFPSVVQRGSRHLLKLGSTRRLCSVAVADFLAKVTRGLFGTYRDHSSWLLRSVEAKVSVDYCTFHGEESTVYLACFVLVFPQDAKENACCELRHSKKVEFLPLVGAVWHLKTTCCHFVLEDGHSIRHLDSETPYCARLVSKSANVRI